MINNSGAGEHVMEEQGMPQHEMTEPEREQEDRWSSLDDIADRCHAFLLAQGMTDASHGLDHIERVVAAAIRIGKVEGADPEVVIPAAWLHDSVLVEKNSPQRSKASSLAADAARRFLKEIDYREDLLDAICHAIEAHSFSAGIEPTTIEAKVVQDADRLDALGAVGLARCLMTGERMGIPLYNTDDPFAEEREPDDRQFVIDHFYAKLFTLPGTMKTEAGRMEAERRGAFLQSYIDQLRSELPPHHVPGTNR